MDEEAIEFKPLPTTRLEGHPQGTRDELATLRAELEQARRENEALNWQLTQAQKTLEFYADSGTYEQHNREPINDWDNVGAPHPAPIKGDKGLKARKYLGIQTEEDSRGIRKPKARTLRRDQKYLDRIRDAESKLVLAERDRDHAQKALADIKEVLADPFKVYYNITNGNIARPSHFVETKDRDEIVIKALQTVTQCLEGNFENACGDHRFDLVRQAIYQQHDAVTRLTAERDAAYQDRNIRNRIARRTIDNLQRELVEARALKVFQQSRMHTSEQNGNCFATCIAILLGYDDYKDVPQWDKQKNWPTYYEEYMTYLAERDFTLLRMEGHPKLDSYYIANGPTSRPGIRHSCIYRNGELVHDPHPDGEGLASVDFIECIAEVGFAVSWGRKQLQAEATKKCVLVEWTSDSTFSDESMTLYAIGPDGAQNLGGVCYHAHNCYLAECDGEEKEFMTLNEGMKWVELSMGVFQC